MRREQIQAWDKPQAAMFKVMASGSSLHFRFARRAILWLFGADAMADEKTKHNYDESKVKTLSSIEHICLRTGMYIGRIDSGAHYDDGCYILHHCARLQE
jgi:hypothetical protein